MHQRRTLSRIDILAIILMGCMAVFVLRLFWLQVVKYDDYVAMARQSQQRIFEIPAARGKIYMMDNGKAVPVVLNQMAYTVVADPAIVKDSERAKIIATLREVAGGEMVADAETRLSAEGSRYAILARNITLSQAERLKEEEFSGVVYQQRSIRNYPEGRLGAQVLGFVNADGEGQYGVEQGMNDRLKGRDGLLQSVTDVRNVPLTVGRDNVHIEPKAGEDVVLSIDRNIQSFAEEALQRGLERAGATEGSVLVMDPNSSEVLAIANYPTYSPADYGQVEDASVYLNAATMIPFEPASVVKTFTLATGIDKGVINPQSTYVNTDTLRVQTETMGNALRGHTGTVTMQQVLNLSLNTGTITMGRLLGDGNHINLQARETMYDYFHERFGFGKQTGIEVNEVAGMIHAPNTIEGNEVRYSNMTFGQGMDVTMMQVAAGFSSVVNGGEYYKPTLVRGSVEASGDIKEDEHTPLRRTISETTSATMRQMLQTARGSSWMGDSDPAGYVIGGKTGTAETITQSGQYTMNETFATYVGFGGSEKPEYVIMVRVAAPGKGIRLEGSTHAGPVFSEISNWMINYMKLPPRR